MPEDPAPIKAAVGRIADELERRIANTPPSPCVDPPAVRKDPADFFWTVATPAAKIGDQLEEGGYTSARAPTDFARLLRAVHAMLAGEIAGLVISGRTGSGKTTAARIVAARALDRYVPPPLAAACLGEDWRHYIVRAARVRASSETDLRALDTVGAARRVYIDDLGFDRPIVDFGTRRDPVGDFLIRWGDARDRGRLLVTTNLDAEGIRARYDDRVLSRLVDACGFLRFDAPDHRLDHLRKF